MTVLRFNSPYTPTDFAKAGNIPPQRNAPYPAERWRMMRPHMESVQATDYIRLNLQKCQACGRCIEECPSNVFAMIEEAGRPHAIIARPENCKGCMTCVRVCPSKAITRLDSGG